MQPTPLFWLECTEAELPGEESWLSGAERQCFRKAWVPKRRRDWVLGRWTAKCALARHLGSALDPESLRRLSVLPAESGAPNAFFENKPINVALSISHSEGRALVLIVPAPAAVGCDLEYAQPRPLAFRQQFFTPSEIAQIERPKYDDPYLLETLMWSAKETILKMFGVGLRADTRSVAVALEGSGSKGWQQFSALARHGKAFSGWWRRDDRWIKTMAADTPTAEPLAFPSSENV